MRLPNLRLPLRFLRGHTGRLALTLVALAWGVALVCAIDVVNRAVLLAFVEVVDTMAGRAALEIAAGEGALFAEDVAAHAAAVPGVELAVLVVMDLFAAERAFTRPGLINRVDVVVARDRDVTIVRDTLAAVLPEGLQVTAPAQRKVDLHRIMRSVQVMLQGVSLLVLLAAFLIVFNRLSAVFEARVWQGGGMRAVGLRPTAVWLQLPAQGLLVGAVGGAVR